MMLVGIDEGLDQMDGAVVGGGDRNHWWWALASASQFGWGIRSYAKGYAGDSRFMPLKAFAVASLFVGAAASASFGVLQAQGIHKAGLDEIDECARSKVRALETVSWQYNAKVEDVMKVGANLRTRLGLPPRAQDKSST